jgi:hypothetical protein
MTSVHYRVLIEVNTDPERRCYDGVHFSSEQRWTAWAALESGLDKATAERRMNYWRSLNDYAVKERGKLNTLREFRLVEEP